MARGMILGEAMASLRAMGWMSWIGEWLWV